MKPIHLLLAGLVLLIAGCTNTESAGNQTSDQSVCAGPVCGSDGVTYDTDCAAAAANVTIGHPGGCEPACSDSDGGLKSEIFGTASAGAGNWSDYCADSSTLVEYICSGGEIANVTVSCGAGMACLGGACEQAQESQNQTEPEQNQSVSQNETIQNQTGCAGPMKTDPLTRQNVTFNGADYRDECIDFHAVKNYYCKDDLMKSENLPCDPGYGCRDGACELQLPTCTETDSGNDTAVWGITTVVKGMVATFKKSDECLDVMTVTEYYCMDDGTAASADIPCDQGFKCVGGKCLKSKCTDSDGGMNIYRQGTASSPDETRTDDCDDNHHIIEYYCYGDNVRSSVESCGKGYFCDYESGRCLEGSLPGD